MEDLATGLLFCPTRLQDISETIRRKLGAPVGETDRAGCSSDQG